MHMMEGKSLFFVENDPVITNLLINLLLVKTPVEMSINLRFNTTWLCQSTYVSTQLGCVNQLTFQHNLVVSIDGLKI